MLCIKADIITSRENRRDRDLPAIAGRLNEQLAFKALIPFGVRAGDELFFLTHEAADGYQAFKALCQAQREGGLPLRIAVGLGGLDPYKGRPDTERINGPAIWRAADAMEELKRPTSASAHILRGKGRLRYNIHVTDSHIDNMTALYYLHFITQRITKRTQAQHEAVAARDAQPDWTHEQLMSWLDEQRGSSTKNPRESFAQYLDRADYYPIREAELGFIHLLEGFRP